MGLDTHRVSNKVSKITSRHLVPLDRAFPAHALLHDPEIIILDEPSSGLDVGSTLVLKRLIRALADAGKFVLYSSHVLELVEQICSSVVILREGVVVASDRIERLRELMEQPSLEQVFTQLAVRQDIDQVAKDLLEAMAL